MRRWRPRRSASRRRRRSPPDRPSCRGFSWIRSGLQASLFLPRRFRRDSSAGPSEAARGDIYTFPNVSRLSYLVVIPAKRLTQTVIAALFPAIHVRTKFLTFLARLGAAAEWATGHSPRATAGSGGAGATAANDV